MIIPGLERRYEGPAVRARRRRAHAQEAKDQSAGCANGEAATYNASVICGSTLAEPAHSEEIDTPMRRTRLRIGN